MTSTQKNDIAATDTAEKLVSLLQEKHLHIATAESCTGGLIAASLVDVSGASIVFEEGYVTYSNEVKIKNLGVSRETIATYSVVSGPVAEEMAQGAAARSGAEVAVSVTGYAGPDAAEDGTPAGTVYIGVWYQGKADSFLFHLKGNRNQVRRQAAEKAMLRVIDTVSKKVN
jgi:PncC family amidohydrolase